ncbi:meiotic recombination protein REC8 homolog [Sceloporus undulatus]|uniref:meiotic recombination protein REC8 homolog n=1 Tax=Sceloporus undulatus TaxID=8520 RepID=UPI001C4BFC9B|nr:meiotic recombination protein REC8 homolog [Sceloporus undulatus]
MFYYPSVLQRHTGCFATIWLAATGATKLLKREYLKVNVPQTCAEIEAFIVMRVPPPMPGVPQPRFSLYLSAQLQYGVVRVYCRQCQYLVEEIQHILERLNRAQQQIRIDLTDLEQPGLLLPNQLALMEALEEAPDPFFGIMEPLLLSPEAIPHVRYILEAPTPERSRPREPSPPSPQRRQPGESPITASPEAITLKEAEPITLLTIEGEQDLPEITGREIDMLVEQEDFLVAPSEEERLRSPHVSPRKRRAEEESAEKVRQQEPLVSLGLSPPTRIGEEPSVAGDAGLALTGEILLPGEVPLLPLEMTPIPEGPRMPPSPHSPHVSPGLERPPPRSPELVLPEYEPSPTQPRRRRRQLRFLDVVTQISPEEFKEQIADTQIQCQPREKVLLPAKRRKTPAELMGTATYGWMHPTLQDLWSRRAKLQRVDYAQQRALKEQAQRAEGEEVAQRAEVPSELEELRAAEEPSVPPMASSEISLETTEEEQHPSLVIPEERILLEEPEEVPLAVVPELPEISFELPLDKDIITLEYVCRLISAKLEQTGEIDFDHLVPLTTSRLVASRFFYTCLVLAATKYMRLEQREPYGRIIIHPGARFRPS